MSGFALAAWWLWLLALHALVVWTLLHPGFRF
jgi:hypothetical protein